MNIFIENVKNKIKLNKNEELFLNQIIEEKEYLKNDFFIQPGQTCSMIGYIEYGTFRIFNINAKGVEMTNWFSTENDIITEILSFINKQPSQEYIQCLENTKIYFISFDNLQEVYRKIPDFHIFIKLVYEEILVDLKKNIFANIHMTTIDRYNNFSSNRNNLLKKVPLKYIASFLGMTDSTLSRVRRKIYSK